MPIEIGTTSSSGMTRRAMLRLLGGAGAGLAALAAGCGTPPSEREDLNGAANGAPAASGQTSIRYWTWMASYEEGNPRSQSQGRILDAFRDRHPEIEVVEEVVPWAELQTQLMQAVAAGRAPDVCRQLDQYIPLLAEAEAIAPLDDFVSGWDDARRDDFIYAWDDTVVDGSKFAFRQALRVANLMYYRPSLLEEAGYDEPPPTIEEFAEAMAAATGGPRVGFLMPFSRGDNLNRFLQTVPPLFWSLGSELVDPATGEPRFHEQAGQQVLQWFQDLVYRYGASPDGQATMDSEDVNQSFQGGNLAVTWHHSSQWASWKDQFPEGDLATMPMPSPVSADHVVPASTEGGWTVCMPAGAQQDPAWALIEFMHSNEAELIDAEVGGELPTRASTLEESYFESEEFDKQREWLDYVNEHAHPATTIQIPNRPRFADILGDACQQIIAREADVAETLEAAAERYAEQVSAG